MLLIVHGHGFKVDALQLLVKGPLLVTEPLWSSFFSRVTSLVLALCGGQLCHYHLTEGSMQSQPLVHPSRHSVVVDWYRSGSADCCSMIRSMQTVRAPFRNGEPLDMTVTPKHMISWFVLLYLWLYLFCLFPSWSLWMYFIKLLIYGRLEIYKRKPVLHKNISGNTPYHDLLFLLQQASFCLTLHLCSGCIQLHAVEVNKVVSPPPSVLCWSFVWYRGSNAIYQSRTHLICLFIFI